jgi:hypothetical protein
VRPAPDHDRVIQLFQSIKSQPGNFEPQPTIIRIEFSWHLLIGSARTRRVRKPNAALLGAPERDRIRALSDLSRPSGFSLPSATWHVRPRSTGWRDAARGARRESQPTPNTGAGCRGFHDMSAFRVQLRWEALLTSECVCHGSPSVHLRNVLNRPGWPAQTQASWSPISNLAL